MKICKCGSRSPRFKGYCEECVTKLKKKYDLLSARNQKLQAEYDEYNKNDLRK